MYTFEVLLNAEHVTSQDWLRFISVIARRVKGFRPLTIDVAFDGPVVRFFVHSRKDLSHLSNGLEGFLLMPIEKSDKELAYGPLTRSLQWFIRTPQQANLFDMKEKYLVKRGIDLIHARFVIQRWFGLMTWRRILTFTSAGLLKRHIKQSFTVTPSILDIDFFTNSAYAKKRISSYLDIEKTAPYFNSRSSNAMLKVDTFPFTTQDRYIHLSDYEFDKHSFIVGSSGSGKSKFIQLFIDRLRATNMFLNYRVIVIDPHDSLREDLSSLPDARIVNFSQEGASLFPESEADVTASTELTSTLLLNMMGGTNARLERILRFSNYVLFVAQIMSLSNLKRFVTDLDFRQNVLAHVHGYIPDNIEHFFGSEFNEIRTQYYTEAIQPIVALVDEMELQPTLSDGSNISIANMVQDNFLTVFSLNKVRMGEKVVKTVAGLLIQQIFLLAQARAFGSNVLLFIDEVSVIQNPTLAAILAEARKFGMSIILTQQYFGQVEHRLQQAILSNAINYYVFKVSEEDARILEGNLSMEIPKEIVEREKLKGLSETDIRVKMMSELHPRDCIIRIAAGGKLLPAIKARTMDIGSHADGGSKMAELQEYPQQSLPERFDFQSSTAVPLLESESGVPEVPIAVSGDRPVEPVASDVPLSVTPTHTRNRETMQRPRRNIGINARSTTLPVGPSMAEVLATQNSSRLPLKPEDLVAPPQHEKKPLAPYVDKENDPNA